MLTYLADALARVWESRPARSRRRRRASRCSARADEAERGPVDVAAVVDSAIKIADDELSRHRARLIRTYETSALVHGNAARLEQVFLNLLVNAAHAVSISKRLAPRFTCGWTARRPPGRSRSGGGRGQRRRYSGGRAAAPVFNPSSPPSPSASAPGWAFRCPEHDRGLRPHIEVVESPTVVARRWASVCRRSWNHPRQQNEDTRRTVIVLRRRGESSSSTTNTGRCAARAHALTRSRRCGREQRE